MCYDYSRLSKPFKPPQCKVDKWPIFELATKCYHKKNFGNAMSFSSNMSSVPLSIALVCASNQNRSMAAHYLCHKNGLNVKSYGTGSNVKLPGKSLYTPNVYNFGMSYEDMLKDLTQQDEKL